MGSLKPNDLGLFDMLGNDLEWCQDPVAYYPTGILTKPSEDKGYNGDIKGIKEGNSRLLRGGAFTNLPGFVRSAVRGRNRPSVGNYSSGLRPARTFR